MKGIILAGGKATRLQPTTDVISKQLLPIYDKPMIYYPLSTLMLANIKDILIISTPKDLPQFKKLLGNGSNLGINISYAEQDKPRGLADAFIIGKDFIGKDRCCLILGDNLIYGHGLPNFLIEASKKEKGATIFSYQVKDPERSGVIYFGEDDQILDLIEKPKNPQSNWAITGLYFCDNKVINFAESLSPSSRGELEIIDILKKYHQIKELEVKKMGRGFVWLDTGTFDSMAEAGEFVRVLQSRSGQKISCPEEIAYAKGFISKDQLIQIAADYKNSGYGEYLLSLI